VASLLAWLGGALFVSSLLYTAYFFLWVLGDADPAGAQPLWSAAAINAALFGLFAGHHSLFARDAVKQRLARLTPRRMERSLYVWVASLLLLAVLFAWQLVDGTVYRADGAPRWLLYAGQLAGVYLTARAAGSMDPLELAGIRQAAQKAGPADFRTDGPFRLVRHPIYLGWILMAFGAPTMTVNRLMFAAISSLYLIVAIPWEETSLVSAFGERYRAYQTQVRWRLIPGIW
jgi:protein-S-isoprenylcysteine O-methyltransferase Ste14